MPEVFAVGGLLPTLIAVGVVLGLMWLGLWLSTRAIRRLAHRMQEEDKERMEEIEPWAHQVIRFTRRTIEGVAGVAAIVIVLRGLGLRGFPKLTWEQMATWLAGSGLRILFVLGSAYVLTKTLHLLIARLSVFGARQGPLAQLVEQRKRAETLTCLLRKLVSLVLISIAGLIVLRELGVDITPILTGAGIAGLAVGFGAQHLVRDILSGFFLILEDQVRVGDVAVINGKRGLVEAIRLRTIVLRGLDGTVHVIPNGVITEFSNMTKDFSYYMVDVGVAYKENVDRVMEVLKEVGTELQADPASADKILAPLEILGVDALADSAVLLKIRIKTVPLQQWEVGRELLRRIKNTFDAHHIEIPYPHLSVYFGEASKPFAVQVAEQLARRESP